jgi:hypothetical protein
MRAVVIDSGYLLTLSKELKSNDNILTKPKLDISGIDII